MFQRCLKLLSAFAFLVSVSIGASTTALGANNSSETLCVSKDSTQVRSVQVVYQNNSVPIPCQVLYERDGVEKEIASAKNTQGYCEKKERQIIKNLVSAGWQCSHSLFGKTAEHQTDLVMDLFPEELITASSSQVQFNADENNLQADRHRDELSRQFESAHRERLQSELIRIFEEQLGDAYTVNVSLDALISVTALTPVSEPDQTLTEPGSVTPSKHTDHAQASSKNELAIVNTNYALLSKSLSTEQQAHQFAAEFRKIYPNINTRVSRDIQTTDQWIVVLGIAEDVYDLEVALAALDDKAQAYFSLVDLTSNDNNVSSLEFIPNDWSRYLIAACYSDGHSSLQSLAECSGFDVNVDSFLNCLSGGVCTPEEFTGVLSQENIDLIEAIGTTDPVAAARGILANSVRGCESMSFASDKELAECVALSILDDEQQLIVECHQISSSMIDVIECAGGEQVGAGIAAYEQCSRDALAGARCLTDLVDNDFVNRTAHCLEAGSDEAIVSCVTQANVGTEAAAVVQCIEMSTEPVAQLSCLSDGLLDEQQQAVLNCATGIPSALSFAACTTKETGLLSHEQWVTAECMLEGNISPTRVLDCSGGRFAGSEIAQCVAAGIDLSDCFGTSTFISDVVNDTVADIVDVGALVELENQIALFRENLYAHEGGDLAVVLSDPANTRWLSSAEEVVNQATDAVGKAGNNVQKATKGLLNKLGFGK